MIKKIDHLVITTNDMESTVAFYEKLGFTAKEEENRFVLFAGDFKINVHLLGKELFPHAQNVMPGSADLCFEIDGNIHDFEKHTKRQGLVAETPVVERNGVLGVMRSIYFYDPCGNLVEVSSYE